MSSYLPLEFQLGGSNAEETRTRLVFFLREHKMSGEFVTAFGDEIFDEVRLSLGEEFLHFIGCDLVLAKFLRQFENLPVLLLWFANVIGVIGLHKFAAMHFAFADHLGFGEIDLRPRFALDGLALLVGFRGTRWKFPANPRIVAQQKCIERAAFFRDETLDQIGLALSTNCTACSREPLFCT